MIWCFDNFNECMVEVVVKDKLIPVCLAPADLTVTCLDIPIGLELDDSETLENLFGPANRFRILYQYTLYYSITNYNLRLIDCRFGTDFYQKNMLKFFVR